MRVEKWEREPRFVNLLQLCGHQGLPPLPTGSDVCPARALCRLFFIGQILDERAVEIEDRDLAPAGRVQIGGVETGALGRLDPLEGWRGLVGCTIRVLAGFREERMIWTALVSFGLNAIGLEYILVSSLRGRADCRLRSVSWMKTQPRRVIAESVRSELSGWRAYLCHGCLVETNRAVPYIVVLQGP